MNADVHALSGAYALDALPADEASAFAEHLDQCLACQQEVAELQVTAAQLGVAVTAPPPAALRDQVLRAVQQTRQIPPVPTTHAAERSRPGWPRLLAAAAAVLLVLGVGVLALRPLLDDAGGPGDPGPQNQVVAVMNAPDARTVSAPMRGGGSMTVVSSRNLDQAVVLGERMPRLDRALDYQLWLVGRSGTIRSAGVLFDGSGRASTGPGLVRGLRTGDQIAITREPAGGSKQPTTAPLAITRRT